MAEKDVTVERIREAFKYDPETGKVSWLINRRGPAKPGDEVGRNSNGYRQTKLDGNGLMVHRIAWALSHGHWPDGDIDHKDGDPGNNKLSNLREATRSQNMQNRQGPQSNSSTGTLGVRKLERNLKKPWIAAVTTNRKRQQIGYFATKQEASAAYLAAKVKLHPFQTLVSK